MILDAALVALCGEEAERRRGGAREPFGFGVVGEGWR